METIDDSTKLKVFPALVFHACGGRDVAVALWRNHSGESIREIAVSMDVDQVTLNRRLHRARSTLQELGIEIPTSFGKQTLHKN